MSLKSLPIKLRGAVENNLKDIDLDLAPGEVTVITGLSGTGKSTLLFDVFTQKVKGGMWKHSVLMLGNLWSHCLGQK